VGQIIVNSRYLESDKVEILAKVDGKPKFSLIEKYTVQNEMISALQAFEGEWWFALHQE
jgi:hypothetical protein